MKVPIGAPFDSRHRTSERRPRASVDDRTIRRTSGGARQDADNRCVRVRKVEQICEELARTVGAASDSCIVSWDDGAAPRIVFATGDTQAVLQVKAGELVGRPASSLFSGGERAARDLAAVCANVPAAE